jgi:hypothetical protein
MRHSQLGASVNGAVFDDTDQSPELRAGARVGGPGRDRTDDLFHAMEARSQLRHRPTIAGNSYVIVAQWLRDSQRYRDNFANQWKICILNDADSGSGIPQHK